MSKVLVVYQSKYDNTENYAKWISEDTGADLRKARGIFILKLTKYSE